MKDISSGLRTVSTANKSADDHHSLAIRVEAGGSLIVEEEDRRMAESEEGEAMYQVSKPEGDPFLWRPLSELQETLRGSPHGLVPLRTIPDLHLSAPDIEQATEALTSEFGRAPSEMEIADKLGIGLRVYRQILDYLSDLEIRTLFAEQRKEVREEIICHLLHGPEDDPLFHCLRSEMWCLLRDAIEHLPQGEHLALSFYYSEEAGSKTISVMLDLAEPRVSEVCASASLSVRASFANSLNRIDRRAKLTWDDLRDCRTQQTRLNALDATDSGQNILGEEATQVYVTGSQDGWVPTTLSWKRFGRREKWDRFVRSWYAIDEKRELTQIRRQERYVRELGFDDHRNEGRSLFGCRKT
jgi:hypothetical protein